MQAVNRAGGVGAVSPAKVMTPRSAFWLAWSTCVLALVLTTLGLLLVALDLSQPDSRLTTTGWRTRYLT